MCKHSYSNFCLVCGSQEPYLRIPKEIFIVARVAEKINLCICFREYTYFSATDICEVWCEYIVDGTRTVHGQSNDQSPVFVAVQATCTCSEIGSHTSLYGTVRCLRCTLYRRCFEVQICALLQIVAFITVVDIYQFFINRRCKIAKSDCELRHAWDVSQAAWNNSVSIGRTFMKLDFLSIFRKSVEKIQV